MKQKRILCLYAHPNHHKSRSNKIIVDVVKQIPSLTFHDLYENYPDYHIDVEREKELLVSHDILMFQHPFYWYSMPPLLKLWEDDVLELGFAYGPEGNALRGKDFLLSITAGGKQDAYCTEGYNRFCIDELITPYIQTANLCGLKWHTPMTLFDANRVSEQEIFEHGENLVKRLNEIAGS